MSRVQLPLALKEPRRPRFDNFVPGANRAVIATLAGGLDSDALCLLVGPAGSGRSHLLAALFAWHQEAGDQALSISLSRSGQKALLEQASAEWLIIDDIDRLAGSAADEMLLFNALNRWRAERCGVVMSAVSVEEFALPDLRSRLGQAVRLTLRPLDEAGLGELIQQLIEEYELVAGAGVVDYLVNRAPRNAASMVQLVEAAARRALTERRNLSIPLLRELLAEQRLPGSPEAPLP